MTSKMFYVTRTLPEYVGFYKALNTTAMPDVDGGSIGSNLPWSAFKPQWVYDDAFYAIFVPVVSQYKGDLFERLGDDSIVIEGDTHRYRLCLDTQRSWTALEQIVNQLTVALGNTGRVAWPLHMESPRPPSSFKYSQWFDSHKNAKRAAMNARRSFLVHFARISCIICMHEGFEPIRMESQPDEPDGIAQPMTVPLWFGHALRKGVPVSLLNDLWSSWVADFRVPRVGGLINILVESENSVGRNTQCYDLIPELMNHTRIPLWLYYGPNPENIVYHKGKRYSKYRLSTDELREVEILRWGSHHTVVPDPTPDTLSSSSWSGVITPQQTWDTTSHPSTSQHGSTENTSARAHYQKGQSPQEYIAEQIRFNEFVKATENESQKETRLRRIRDQEGQPRPTGGKPLVFLWEQEFDGGWIRGIVGRSRVGGIWEQTSPTQRWYNDVRNEYEVCHDLDPGAETEEDAGLGWDEDTYPDAQTTGVVSQTPDNDRFDPSHGKSHSYTIVQPLLNKRTTVEATWSDQGPSIDTPSASIATTNRVESDIHRRTTTHRYKPYNADRTPSSRANSTQPTNPNNQTSLNQSAQPHVTAFQHAADIPRQVLTSAYNQLMQVNFPSDQLDIHVPTNNLGVELVQR